MRSRLHNLASNISNAIMPAYAYPEPGRVVVLDVHQYSGVIKDWQRLKENAAAILIKITDGVTIARNARENWEGAGKAGVLRGSWGWLYKASDISVNTQARKAVEFLKYDPGELPYFCDFETTRYNFRISNPGIGDLWSFMDVYENESGRVPGIYTGYYYWLAHGSPAGQYARHPLWIASYNPKPILPLPWNRWTFWQWTEKGFGEDFGVDKYQERAVDLNYFNGARDDLLMGRRDVTGFDQMIKMGDSQIRMRPE